MKKPTYSDIFNIKNSDKSKKVIILVGFVLTIVCSVLYGYFYSKVDFYNITQFENELSLLFICVILIFLGVVMTIATLNLESKKIRFILVLLLGGLIYAVIREKPVRLAFIILLSSIAIFVITKLLSKVFSTLITFSLCSLSVFIFLKIFSIVTPQMNASVCVYICITAFLLLYNIFGTKLNRLCLRCVFGHSPDDEKDFDYSELKNQINFLYLLLFVPLNLFLMFNEQEMISLIANAVNNALITGVCITNVNWKSLLWK